jgi:hypothetical protein
MSNFPQEKHKLILSVTCFIQILIKQNENFLFTHFMLINFPPQGENLIKYIPNIMNLVF